MRTRIPIRTVVATALSLTLPLTAAAPAGATPAGGAVGTATTDPATSTVRPAGTVGLAAKVAKDGNGPFTPDDRPGGDSSGTNGIVRTLDAITYSVEMSVNDGDSVNQRFVVTAPAGTTWAGLPKPCTGAASRIDGQRLTCSVGDLTEGNLVEVPVVLDVSGTMRHGDEIEVTVEATADNADNGVVTAVAPTVTVSAAARYNLSKDVVGSSLTPDVIGPDGERGLRLVYPIAVNWEPVVAGQGLLGFEASAGPMAFTDDVSEILGDLPSTAVLWNGTAPACGVNATNAWRFDGLPGGRGGGPRNVVDSGTIVCTQSSPGADVDVTITDTVTDPDRIPTQSLSGGPVTGGTRAYFVSGYLSLWLPYPPGSVLSTNRYSALQTTSASGAQNYPGSEEPLADNSTSRNLVGLGSGTAGKRLWRVIDSAGTTVEGSARAGDPWVTQGQVLRSDVTVLNDGYSRWTGTILCDTFDRGTQRLTRGGTPGATAWTSGLSRPRIEYAAYDMTNPAAGQDHTCGDDDGPWFASPDEVPGGRAAVGAVRALGDVDGGARAVLHTYVAVADAPSGTRAYDFGHALLGEHTDVWTHDTARPENGAGAMADSVVITENLARIRKKIVDPGTTAEDTPDKTSFVGSGSTLEYALYPTLTNGHSGGQATTVTVRDVLPMHTDYIPESASRPAELDTITDNAGNLRQRLTWTLDGLQPNTRIPPITYELQVSSLAPAGPVQNYATIASPTDRSEAFRRDTQRAVQVVAAVGVGVEKVATEPVVATGDQLEWDLLYTNRDARSISGLDVIDVLPHRGDPQGSAFHGTVSLADRVDVAPGAGETVRYTTSDPASISLDGTAASNQPGGSTLWCAAADLGDPACGSAELADVTAVRIERTGGVAPGQTVRHHVVLRTHGERDGDTYTNRFGLRASNLELAALSNRATVRVVAGSIGNRVWTDSNDDGLQGSDEPGIDGVPIRLSGVDDRGTDVARATRSGPDGEYSFDGLRPGDYVVAFTAPDGRRFTKEHVGTDGTIDSDAGQDGETPAVSIAWERSDEGAKESITRDRTVDAGLLLGDSPSDPEPEPGPDPGTVPGAGTGPGSGPGGGSGSTAVPTVAPSPGARGGVQGLAFTGTSGTPLVLGVALLLLALGAAMLGTNRNQRRQR
ncbi:SdrD B-like domain-containing protein [Curtobacterium sp. 8I-2]|uniref:SdrD B-like domain-containing protein n=1 Tax=Curtobacterium sp. 8I-2 TaxID=2653136 RepID=UPI0012F1879F|nr:SdrD B-like domain-containing protein [Curtobacterium sp. 8I-2]VXC23941.1 conserved exported hypothetical protein [Curtobacterium sp. 8I-2]